MPDPLSLRTIPERKVNVKPIVLKQRVKVEPRPTIIARKRLTRGIGRCCNGRCLTQTVTTHHMRGLEIGYALPGTLSVRLFLSSLELEGF